MKKIILVLLLSFCLPVFAAESVSVDPNDGVVVLIEKLKQKDIEIEALKDSNLNLLVSNLTLKETNKKLRLELDRYKKSATSAKKTTLDSIRESLKNLDKQIQKLY